VNPRIAIRLLGRLVLFIGLAMLGPAGVSLGYGERETALVFVVSALVTSLFGFILSRIHTEDSDTVHRRDAFLFVTGGWILAGAFGALPFLLDGTVSNFTDAYFEAVSGFTTTGSTILTDIEATSQGCLMWRSLMHWLGGMGIVVLFVAIFPQLGVGGKFLFQSEGSGNTITEGLKPRIKETSAILWRIYVGLTAVNALALYLCGMNLFDAVNHAMSTMASGGFSTKNASIGAYDNVGIDAVTTVFMVLAGINFSLYFLISRGRWRRAFSNRELWTYLAVAVLATLFVTISIINKHGGLFTAFRYAVFQTVSIITGTGFGTDNFDVYPPASQLLLVILMFVGGCAGSTTGGIKIYRMIVMVKACNRELIRAFRPQLVQAVRVGRAVVPEETVRAIFACFALFMAIFLLMSLCIAAMGIDIVTATTSVAATLSNIGPGLARVGSVENYAFLPAAGKWLLSVCMIMGRLEVVTVAALLTPTFWRR